LENPSPDTSAENRIAIREINLVLSDYLKMRINLNNIYEDLEGDQMTISDLLRVKNFSFRLLVIKVNGQLVRKNEYDSTRIKDGDTVVVLHLISGG
jgi:thiamine biosynthesis protein ThiS